jgi:hypothetical protein
MAVMTTLVIIMPVMSPTIMRMRVVRVDRGIDSLFQIGPFNPKNDIEIEL